MFRVFSMLAAVMVAMWMGSAWAEPTQAEKDFYLFRAYEDALHIDGTGDFTNKDPFAAYERGRKLKRYVSLEEFVIGGMHVDFRNRLYAMAKAMEEDGLRLCITSGFRDAFRQAMITKGLGAGIGPSFHGGNGRGYGYGSAADVVGCPEEGKGRWANHRPVWRWIDERGKDFGICRPYGNFDHPHVGPCDGPEYLTKAHVRTRFGTEITPPQKVRLAKVKKKGKKHRIKKVRIAST